MRPNFHVTSTTDGRQWQSMVEYFLRGNTPNREIISVKKHVVDAKIYAKIDNISDRGRQLENGSGWLARGLFLKTYANQYVGL
jgi:hypothetical protein